ncbi:efflux RND transporter periplasmic adaptor subunit [Hymenobacter negativus]|uniref:Efflux RND transporter periplasmic adaptor subunit n=1 Tax=Hymenobacter negativus TaxID=2795026 RepID=A0ABS3QJ11_9BACT|nr:efflux RND transporter periplasmic adaptor subunit [Hymenobacter negativus]MBO2011091.1 efflux RND transporter periplasmic adaptor subunit [Hymenobacter negativus]
MLGALLLVILLGFGIPKVLSANKTGAASTESAAPAAPSAVLVDSYVVRPTASADALQATGTIQANQEVQLVSEVARKVTGIYAHEGTTVAKGTLLFRLDDADLQARRRKLKLQEKLALLDDGRMRGLLRTESVTQQEYDQVSTNLQVLQADIQAVDVDLAKTQIRAPFAGRIGLNKVDVGAYVTPSTVLTSLEDVSQVEVTFTVPERYAAEVRPGQTIQFTTENGTAPQSGRIIATEPRTDVSTRSLLVKAISPNPKQQLVPGMSAKISFALHVTSNALVVPTQALIPTAKGYALYAIKDGKANYRDVTTGPRSSRTVQVLSGLSAGDTVITTNLLRLGPGAPVQVASGK